MLDTTVVHILRASINWCIQLIHFSRQYPFLQVWSLWGPVVVSASRWSRGFLCINQKVHLTMDVLVVVS